MQSQKPVWFRAKKYGWGWTPITWQGWIIVILYLAILYGLFFIIDQDSHSVSDTLFSFVIPLIPLTTLFLWICYKKGERPHWRWGK